MVRVKLDGRLRLRKQESGASIIEFTLVFALVFLPALMTIFEFAQLSVARQNLRYAVFEMVRAAEAAAEPPDANMLRTRLGRALLPSLANRTDGGAESLVTSVTLAARPDLFDITYRATGVTEIDAVTVIETSELEVRWCRELFFAPIKYVIPAMLRMGSISWFEQACYARQSIPIVAKAYVVRSTVPRNVRIL